MKNGMFEKGDWVRVWSLQSFHHGGFLEGAKAFVRQSQRGSSVILCVMRNIDGVVKLDESYEVYAKQCELIYIEDSKSSVKKIEDYYDEIMALATN